MALSLLLTVAVIMGSYAVIVRLPFFNEGTVGDAFLEESRVIPAMAQEVAAETARPGGPAAGEAQDILEGRVRDWLAANRPDVALRSLTMALTGQPGQEPYWQVNFTLEEESGRRLDARRCVTRAGQSMTCPER